MDIRSGTIMKLLLVLLSGCLHGLLAYSKPISIWPLYSVNPTYDLRTQTSAGKAGCSLSTGDPFSPTLDYSSVRFQSSPLSVVDLPVPGLETEIEDFSVVVTIKASSATSGTIFHFVATDNTGAGIHEMSLLFDETSTVLHVKDDNGRSKGEITASPQITIANVGEWISFAVSYDASKQEIRLFTNIDSHLGTVKLSGGVCLGQPGIIRLGRPQEGSNGPYFSGDMICCALYNNRFAEGDFSQYISECQNNSWPNPYPSNTASNDCVSYNGYFNADQKNVAVATSIATLVTRITKSRVQCADACESHADCVSFTFTVSDRMCRLYEAVHGSLVASDGTNYYIRRDQCC
ncbi:uncharacterized protein LOC128218745 [Mya arenaria]|uniref:uncharacterized protein LOC128218745 n=1 Tax=Mya arenaria TaxID=6604 RepID=UPI0022E5E843|nr:uncharacterized protein LOC128218745 [Mya arenaria]